MSAPRFSAVVVPTRAGTTEDGTTGDGTAETTTLGSLQRQEPRCEVLQATGTDPTAVARAARSARGDFVFLVGAGDSLGNRALAAVDAVIADDVDFVYTDEDAVDGTIHRDQFYKPDWSPERLRGQHYTGRLSAYRRSLLEEVGGFRPEAGSAYEFDAALRIGERARRVAHVTDALYHRRADRAPEPVDPADVVHAVAESLVRTGAQLRAEAGEGGTVRLLPALREQPRVSIVIPTAGVHASVNGKPCSLVVNCVERIVERSTYPDYEIVCVYDPSAGDETLRSLRDAAGERLRLVEYTAPFNFAHKINLGAIKSRGEYLVLLNDDTEIRTPTWIETMLAFASDETVGAVGAKLLFGDGRIQHAGVVLSAGEPGHPYYGYPADHDGYHRNLRVASNFLATTAACLMVRKRHFELVGGLAGVFPRNYNDVDFCLKLHYRGLRNVVTPEVVLNHYESSSRGAAPVEKHERALLELRWGTRLRPDPYYNPNFMAGADYLALVAPDGRPAPQRGLA